MYKKKNLPRREIWRSLIVSQSIRGERNSQILSIASQTARLERRIVMKVNDFFHPTIPPTIPLPRPPHTQLPNSYTPTPTPQPHPPSRLSEACTGPQLHRASCFQDIVWEEWKRSYQPPLLGRRVGSHNASVRSPIWLLYSGYICSDICPNTNK